jgi:DNA-binding NtrC family response regulator
MDEKAKILIVYDELTTRVSLQLILAKEDYDVQAVGGAREALQILAESPIDVIFTDLRIKRLLTKTQGISPETIVIVLASPPSVESAVKAIPHDVYDYLVKPYEAEAVKRATRRAVEHKQLTARLSKLSVFEKRLEDSEERYRTLV